MKIASSAAVRQLLVIAAGVEVGAGVGALAVPDLAISLLLGTASDEAARMAARVLGLALIALAICCWTARADSPAASRAGVVTAITLYNASAAALLATFAAIGLASGPVVWLAAGLHGALAAAFIAAPSIPGVLETSWRRRQPATDTRTFGKVRTRLPSWWRVATVGSVSRARRCVTQAWPRATPIPQRVLPAVGSYRGRRRADIARRCIRTCGPVPR